MIDMLIQFLLRQWISLHLRGVAHYSSMVHGLYKFSTIIRSIRFHRTYSILHVLRFLTEDFQIIFICSNVTDIKKNRLIKF